MKILIFGKTGQVGKELIREVERHNFSYLALGREDVNLSDDSHIKSVINDYSPDVIINAAAYTQVDEAENNNNEAARINSEFPKILAKTCSSNDIKLIHYSTDYIFNGKSMNPIKEYDNPIPINYYGITKLEGENNILNNHKNYFIFRTSWVYSIYSNNFLRKIIARAKETDTLSIVNDQFGTPTSASFISYITILFLKYHPTEYGIYNLVPNGNTNWHFFANYIINALKNNKLDYNRVKKIKPISSTEFKTLAERPRYSVLDNTKISKLFDKNILQWELYVDRTIEELITSELI